MRRTFTGFIAVTMCGVLASCAVATKRSADEPITKVAATEEQVDRIYEKYRQVRNAAIKLLDAKPLSTIETGPILAIDTGSFVVSQRLNRSQRQDTGPINVTQVQTPRFSSYPLWIFAVAYDEVEQVQRLQIFERNTAVDPWLLVASPEALASTRLPSFRRDESGSVLTVDPDDERGIVMSAQDAAEAYAKVAKNPKSDDADRITNDGFLRQMHQTAKANANLRGVRFRQTWKAEKVDHVLRDAEGGALAFVTLLRTDTYTVAENRKVVWPKGSAQEALLEDGIQGGSASLNYYHQIAVHLPTGTAKPRTIGQIGGVATGSVGGSAVGASR